MAVGRTTTSKDSIRIAASLGQGGPPSPRPRTWELVTITDWAERGDDGGRGALAVEAAVGAGLKFFYFFL